MYYQNPRDLFLYHTNEYEIQIRTIMSLPFHQYFTFTKGSTNFLTIPSVQTHTAILALELSFAQTSQVLLHIIQISHSSLTFNLCSSQSTDIVSLKLIPISIHNINNETNIYSNVCCFDHAISFFFTTSHVVTTDPKHNFTSLNQS